MSTLRIPRQEKPPQAVSPDWRWHELPIYPCAALPVGSPGVLEIAGQLYTVIVYGDRGTARAVRLVKPDGATYDIDLAAKYPSCDCPDGIYRPHRPGGCKHLVAIREALPTPDRPRPCCKECKDHDDFLRAAGQPAVA